MKWSGRRTKTATVTDGSSALLMGTLSISTTALVSVNTPQPTRRWAKKRHVAARLSSVMATTFVAGKTATWALGRPRQSSNVGRRWAFASLRSTTRGQCVGLMHAVSSRTTVSSASKSAAKHQDGMIKTQFRLRVWRPAKLLAAPATANVTPAGTASDSVRSRTGKRLRETISLATKVGVWVCAARGPLATTTAAGVVRMACWTAPTPTTAVLTTASTTGCLVKWDGNISGTRTGHALAKGCRGLTQPASVIQTPASTRIPRTRGGTAADRFIMELSATKGVTISTATSPAPATVTMREYVYPTTTVCQSAPIRLAPVLNTCRGAILTAAAMASVRA